MKFTCEKDSLLKEISVAQEIAVKGAGSLSILSNVLLSADKGTLFIRATDLKVSFETKIPIEVSEAGSITIPCDMFLSVLRTLKPGDVEFMTRENDTFFIKPLFKKAEIWLKSVPLGIP